MGEYETNFGDILGCLMEIRNELYQSNIYLKEFHDRQLRSEQVEKIVNQAIMRQNLEANALSEAE